MKFGKFLQSTCIDFPPEMVFPFVRYKQLKKLLNRASADAALLNGVNDTSSNEQQTEAKLQTLEEFVKMLVEDVHDINEFFIEKEQVSLIKLFDLKTQLAEARTDEQLAEAGKALLEYHGELVLLLYWSFLNYAAITKILKKHDKRLGGGLKAQSLPKVLHQPFRSTEQISDFLRVTDDQLEIFIRQVSGGHLSCNKLEGLVALVHRQTQVARLWTDLRDKAHTPSTILPPTKKQRTQ